MKYTLSILAATALIAPPALSAGLEMPVEEVIIAEPEKSSSTGILIPLLALAVVAALIAADSDDTPPS